jgi:hypothetical protein
MGRPRKQPFIQIDTNFHSTTDLVQFALRLRPSMPEAMRPFAIEVMYCAIGRVFGAFLEHNRSGLLEKTAPEMVEYWAGWRGVSGAFFDAFREIWCEPVDGGHRVRGWHKRYGSMMPKESKPVAKQRVRRPVPAPQADDVHESVEDIGAVLRENCTENGTNIGDQSLEVRKELTEDASYEASSVCAAVGSTATSVRRAAHGPSPALTPTLDADDDRTAAATQAPKRKRKLPSGLPKAETSKWPHFPHEDRKFILECLIAAKKSDLTGPEVARLYKAFGDRWYRLPEAERQRERPTNSEVRYAVQQVLEATEMADNGGFLRAPESLAECIGRVVDELRIPRFDPEERIENIMLATGLRRRRSHLPVTSYGR